MFHPTRRFSWATQSGHRSSVALSLWILGCGAALAQTAQDPRHPVIARYGAITPAPDAANQPDRSITYRAVFEITRAAADSAQINPSLDRVARFVNLLGSAGISVTPGNLVAIVHGPATPLVLADTAHQTRFGRPNPNSALLAALREAGVEVHVCSQALVRQGIAKEAVARAVTVDLSAMTTLATLQLKGWALIQD